MKAYAVILLIVILGFGQVQAENKRFPEWKASLLLDEPSASSSTVRSEIARGLRHETRAILAFLPSLRAEQVQWLTSERDALRQLSAGDTFNSKAKQLTSSPEFALEKLRSSLIAIEEALSCALERGISINREALCWARVNLLLTDSSTMNDAMGILILHNTVALTPEVTKQLGFGDSIDDLWLPFNFWGRGVQERIVIPLLERLK